MANSKGDTECEADVDDVHSHPIPSEEVSRYGAVRDPDSEREIADYVESQARDEVVQHVELIRTDYVIGEAFEVWDVTTDKGRWWVLTNMTNLYSQQHFPSLDYTLSFHIGLMMRLRSRHEGADASDPHPFDEVFRRQEQAKDRHDRAIEAEDYQSVGMQLRECLLSLIGAVRRRVPLSPNVERPQDANFTAWVEVLMNALCSGNRNERLRSYLKNTAKETWQLVNWLTHNRNATEATSLIAIYACDTVVGHFVQILERDRMDKTGSCPVCKSRNIRTHFDIAIGPDGDYYTSCGICNWSSHPGADQP